MNRTTQRSASITAIASPDPKSNRPISKREDAVRGRRALRGAFGDDIGKLMILVEMIPNAIERMVKTSIVNIGVQL